MTGPSLYGTRCNAVCDHKHKNLDCVHPQSAGSGDELSWLAHIVNATYLSSQCWSFMYGCINSRLLDRNCLCWENSTSWIYLPRLGGRLSALVTSYFLFNEASLERKKKDILLVLVIFHYISLNILSCKCSACARGDFSALPLLEHTTPCGFLHSSLLFFLGRLHSSWNWQASPLQPSSHSHIPQSQ